MNLIQVVTALAVRALEIGAGRSCALCQNGSREFRLPKWRFAIARVFRLDLRKLGAFPQFFPTCAGSALAQVGKFSALFCASWGASPKNPVFAKTAILAGVAQVGKNSAFLPVLLAQVGKNCGDLHRWQNDGFQNASGICKLRHEPIRRLALPALNVAVRS